MVSLFDFFRGNSRSYPPSPPSPPVRNAGLGSPAVQEAATHYQILQGFLQLRGGVLLLLVPVFRIRGALRCETSPRAHSCHRGYDSGPHARRASQLEATKRTLSLSLTLALARLRPYRARELRKRRQKQNLTITIHTSAAVRARQGVGRCPRSLQRSALRCETNCLSPASPRPMPDRARSLPRLTRRVERQTHCAQALSH